MIKRIVKMKDELPVECPKCLSEDLCIDNIDGMECMGCGCWFNADPDGSIDWAYDSRPMQCE